MLNKKEKRLKIDKNFILNKNNLKLIFKIIFNNDLEDFKNNLKKQYKQKFIDIQNKIEFNDFINYFYDYFSKLYLNVFNNSRRLFNKYNMPQNIQNHSVCVSLNTLFIIFNLKIGKIEKLNKNNYYRNVVFKKIKKFYSILLNKKERNKIFNYSIVLYNAIIKLIKYKNYFYMSLFLKYLQEKKIYNLLKTDLDIQKGEIFLKFLVKQINASLLHDIGKIFEIKKESNYNHAITGYNILKNENLFYEAICSKYHLIDGFFEMNRALSILIVNVSDKMVMHSKCVMLKQRFEDLIKRYPQFKEKFTYRNFKIYKYYFSIFNIKKRRILNYFNKINLLFN